MGELYNKMARDLALKNLAARTRQEYLRCCTEFTRYHMRSPRELGSKDIKEFLGHLLMKGAGPETVKMHVAGLKFLYGVTLEQPRKVETIPWPKVPHRKPDILSGTELEKLMAALSSLVPAMALLTAYGAGLRVSEACRLRVEDIDSKRSLIHVRLGKGNKDRYVMLSARLLRKHHEHGWLFRTTEPFFTRMEQTYERGLAKFLAVPWVAIIVLVVAAGLILVLNATIPRELAPMEDRGRLWVRASAPDGVGYDYMQAFMDELATATEVFSLPEWLCIFRCS